MPETLRIDEMRKNGVSCLMLGNDGKTVYGFRVLNQPPRISPRERYESITIPGRSGSLTLTEGNEVHDNITLSCTAYIESTEYYKDGALHNRVAEITQWISGEGKYEFYGHPDGYYKGRLANQVSFDRIVQGNPHKAFTFQFDCQPYFYLTDGDRKRTGSGTYSDVNVANCPAKPLIKLYGIAGSRCSVMLTGGSSMIINSMPADGNIVIDSEAEIVYSENAATGVKTLAGTSVQGDFMVFPPTSPLQMVTTNITSYEVTPRWRQK